MWTLHLLRASSSLFLFRKPFCDHLVTLRQYAKAKGQGVVEKLLAWDPLPVLETALSARRRFGLRLFTPSRVLHCSPGPSAPNDERAKDEDSGKREEQRLKSKGKVGNS